MRTIFIVKKYTKYTYKKNVLLFLWIPILLYYYKSKTLGKFSVD